MGTCKISCPCVFFFSEGDCWQKNTQKIHEPTRESHLSFGFPLLAETTLVYICRGSSTACPTVTRKYSTCVDIRRTSWEIVNFKYTILNTRIHFRDWKSRSYISQCLNQCVFCRCLWSVVPVGIQCVGLGFTARLLLTDVVVHLDLNGSLWLQLVKTAIITVLSL